MRSLFHLSLFALLPSLPFAAEAFKATPDHLPQPGVPTGRLIAMPALQSKIFAGTTRDWWVYVPAGYKPDGSAALMVFQDGRNYHNPTGNFRVPIVFENLIARGEMPVTVAVMVNPGNDPTRPPNPAKKAGTTFSNRGLEYDSLGDRYVRMLLEEILPEVEKQFPVSKDPAMRAISGSSSGGIAAFTAAWERPDQFGKVHSTVGSFVNLRGGDAYPALVRKTERKPLRVYLEDVSGDLDNNFGNWPIANKQMHAALRYMGYDTHLEWAEGYSHGSVHGGSVFPDALRWLWRKETPKPEIVTKGDLGGDMTLHRLLIEGEGWQPVVENIGFGDALATDDAGNFYFCDMRGAAPGIYRIALDGTKTKLSDEVVSGMKFGPDGRAYACQGAKKRVVAIDLKTGAVEVIVTEVQPNDLVVTRTGHLYFTHTAKKEVAHVNLATKALRAAAGGIANPNGITLSPDQGTLAVSEHRGGSVWTFRVNADGSLDAGAPTMAMRRPIDPKGEFKSQQPPPYLPAASGDGMTTDEQGRYYVTTALGIQVFDPTGRLCGVLAKTSRERSEVSCVLSGPGRNYLYVGAGTAIYRRKVQATGVALK
ncbi:MAG: SMP-30/gluconolactonase/LRE family protein [Opitutaceae bacterium]|nr:SMP-30/gluconolactonase/LRE family protein [Opitutaceae bacterium]